MVNEINSILDYIEEHIQEEIGLTELSETFHYSESYISRMFNRYVGMSIKEYLNKRRLSRIAVLLRKEHKSVEYLAHTHGYSSQKYLSTLFKKEFQLTPSAYKKTDSFIHITPRRNVKGEENMKIKNTKELCEMIFKKTATQNDLLDLISSMENCELIEQENSDIRLVTYVDEEKYTQIYEVKLNVLSGHYTSQEIFYFKKDDYRITKFYKNDEIRLEFEDINSGKLLDAVLYEGVVTEVMLDSKVLKEFIIDNSQSDITPEEFRDGHLNVERISKELLTLTNDQEVMDYLSNDKELIPLKSFGGEYVIIKLSELRKHCRLDSIYLNMNEKRFFNHCFFGLQMHTSNVEIRNVEGECHFFADDELYSIHTIMNGEELPSSISIRFPSGMCGNGGWDFSSEFK